MESVPPNIPNIDKTDSDERNNGIVPQPLAPTPVLDEVLGWFSLAPRWAGLTADRIRLLLRVYAIVIFFNLVVRPLAIFIGPPGSGKTSLARALGILRVGPYFEVSSLPRDERDWIIGLGGRSYDVADNLEVAPAYFPGAAARVATGAESRYRKLYSNDEKYIARPQCFLAITTATPSYLAYYLLERALIFQLPRPDDFVPESTVQSSVTSRRNEILSEISAVQGLVNAWVRDEGLPNVNVGRLADFAALGFYIAEATHGIGGGVLFLQAMIEMQREREMLLGEADDVLGALLSWTDEHTNEWVAAGQLLAALSARCGNPGGFDLSRRDAARFGLYLAHLRERVAGVLTWEKRTHRGLSQYRFARVSSARGAS